MTYSRKYSRNFIPLKQDNQNYSLDFRPALGKCLIEIKDGKGKITVYAQGIKPDNSYNVEMMCFDDGKLKNISIGTLAVDNMGKGEIRADFNPENVFDTGNKIEDFNIIALIVDGIDEVISSLVGYVGNEVNWREKYVIPKKEDNCQKLPKPTKPPVLEKPNLSDNLEKPNLSDLEKALIKKAEGLIEREKGLICKEKNININMPVNLEDLEIYLNEKEEGLTEKEKGLLEKENGLLEKEQALNNGFLSSDEQYSLRQKEKQLINIEKQLIQKEYALILKERNLIKKMPKPKTEKEKGLRERQIGLLMREKGLLEKEKGLIEKEEGLFEKEDGMREKNKNENNTKFKDMIDKLKRDIYKLSENDDIIFEKNDDIEYIKQNNMKLTPFKNNDENIDWFRISPYELSIFDGDIWKYMNNHFVFNCYKNFNHLMLGIKQEGNFEKYILGIPCKYETDFSILEFEKFVSLEENTENKFKDGEYGYRLIEIC